VNITIADERDDPLPVGAFADLAATVLSGEGLPVDTEVAITLVDPQEMTVLNEQYMGKSGPTDVLAFPLEDLVPGSAPVATRSGPPVALGDVVICPAVVQANTADDESFFADEMALMVVHGLLHLLGYDHIDDADAEQMESREQHYLEQVGRRRR
jgi:probable rRNA maturation factor